MFGSLRRGFLVSIIVVAILTLAAWGQANLVGQWSAVQNLPYRPVHAHLLPSGKIFFFSYYSESNKPQIWNPATGTTVPAATASYLLFCAGHNFLPNGTLLITGGHAADYVGLPNASIYNPFTDSWKALPNMNAGRWYPTDVTLSNGDTVVLAGSINTTQGSDPLAQVWQLSTSSWRNLTSAALQLPLYPRAVLAPNGKVFVAAPSVTTRYLTTSGTGAWSTVGTTKFGSSRDYGAVVIYDSGKIVSIGGGDPPTNTAEVIDLNATTPAWAWTGAMSVARRQTNGTVLPDGKVLVTGGSSGSGFDDSTHPVHLAEMWDPATGKFTPLSSNTVYRGYHSVAVLLPDGRVFSGGGNVGGPNYEIYSPPYLFKGARPTITSAPSAASYGQTIFVQTPDVASITQATLIRLPSVTHSFNMDQSFSKLTFTQGTGGLNMTLPSNSNLAPPGYYMLFILNGSGVPSVAAILQLTTANGTTGTIMGEVTDSSGKALSGAVVSYNGGQASTDTNGDYALTNVPAGSVQITASMKGYTSQMETVTVTAGQTTTAPTFALSSVSTGSISGAVTDTNNNPLSGATVAYSGGSTTTDSTGHYTLNNVPEGSITLTASLSGYESASETVTVTVGQTTTAPTFVLQAAPVGTIQGHVTNMAGAALAGATVAYGGGSTTTDSSGNYVLTKVPAGTVQVSATLTGYQTATQNVTVTAGQATTANFTLSAAAAGTVSGKVTSISTGGLIVGATVKYSGGSTTTNSSGVYSFSNVPGSTQTFTASANGYLSRSSTITVNGTTTLNFQLSTAGQIAGKVTTSSGAPVAGATVTMTGGVIATTVTVTTNSTGNYISGWVPIGSYAVTASATGLATTSATTTVNTGATSTVNISMGSGGGGGGVGSVTGKVTNISNGAALSGATVSYSGGSTTTNSSGVYTFSSVTAGTYNFTASANGYLSRAVSVSVTAGATTTSNFQVATAGKIVGTVKNGSGAAIGGATVTVKGGLIATTVSLTTSSTGTYATSWIPVGSYTVTVAKSGFTTQSKSANVTSGATTTVNFAMQ